MDPDIHLTFELTPDAEELQIHANHEGLRHLIRILDLLQKQEEDHDHLTTPSWGGNDLSEELHGEGHKLINHVKVYVWRTDNLPSSTPNRQG